MAAGLLQTRGQDGGAREPAQGRDGAGLVHITTVPLGLTLVAGQSGYMAERGFSPVAISSPGPLLDQFAEREGFPVHAVPMDRRVTPLKDLVAIARLWRILRARRPLVVHSHTPKGGLLGMISAWLAGVPVRVYQIHGLPFVTAKGPKRLLLRLSETVSCLLAHRVFCDSRSMLRIAVEEGFLPAAKGRVLIEGSANGVDAAGRFNPSAVGEEARREVRARFGIPPEARVVGFIGRIVRDKGLVELTKAWQELSGRYPDLHLLVVGPFEPQDPLPAEVERSLREDPRIHLAGLAGQTAPYFAASDLLVLPTYREGLPIVTIEAAAMGLPVVATRIPGCVDAVQDGVTGTLVPPYDAGALAGAIAAYLDDPELRSAHGRAGRERVLRDFRPEAIWAELCDEYRALLRRNGCPAPELGPVGDERGAEPPARREEAVHGPCA